MRIINIYLGGRTTCHAGYVASQRIRKRIEECFGWAKPIGGLRKSRIVGREKLDFQFLMTFAAHNLVRMRIWGWAHIAERAVERHACPDNGISGEEHRLRAKGSSLGLKNFDLPGHMGGKGRSFSAAC